MIFYSKRPNKRYTIIPAVTVVEAGRARTVKGLSVKFRNGYLDTEAAQKLHKWSDEQREEVEAYLRDHGDFNVTMFEEDPDGGGARMSREIDPRDLGCLHIVPGDFGPTLCGASKIEGSPYCSKHQKSKVGA